MVVPSWLLGLQLIRSCPVCLLLVHPRTVHIDTVWRTSQLENQILLTGRILRGTALDVRLTSHSAVLAALASSDATAALHHDLQPPISPPQNEGRARMSPMAETTVHIAILRAVLRIQRPQQRGQRSLGRYWRHLVWTGVVLVRCPGATKFYVAVCRVSQAAQHASAQELNEIPWVSLSYYQPPALCLDNRKGMSRTCHTFSTRWFDLVEL